jgi:biopolymer transport protein ExbD
MKMIKNKLNKFYRKSQAFSTEIIVVVVMLLVITLFVVAQQFNEKQITSNNLEIEKLKEKSNQESKLIVESLKKEKILNNENKVNIEKLSSIDKNKIKEELGITGDFAIVFEKDGKLVKINPESNQTCIGSNKIVVNGVPCK